MQFFNFSQFLRVMQKFLNKASPEDLDFFISSLGYNVSVLMTDLYGNYFCQKLVQSCSSEQRVNILNYVIFKKFLIFKKKLDCK